nr:peptidylprolyl isomerase [Seonamhaeicola sp. ML3]
MLLKTNSLKYINRCLIATLLFANALVAQEVIEDKPQEHPIEKKQDSVPSNFNTVKVDGIAAVVGDFIILESDIPKEREQIIAAGGNLDGVSNCQLMGSLLENKLYAHHAIQDSIIVSDVEIRQQVDYQIQQFLQYFGGSMEKLLAYYKKEDEQSFKDEMFEINKNTELAKRMRSKIVQEVEITPEEVREYFNKIPKESRPTFGTELKVAQIVAEPKISEEEEQRIIDKLNGFREDVMERGASFRSKAVLYGEDPGLKQSGYIYTLDRKKPRMVREFRQAAFALKEGEVSEPFKTDFGYHIVYCQKIRGQQYDVSHVLLKPRISNKAIQDAKERLEKVRQRIIDGDITFADAAREASDEKATRNDGGQLINPETQDYNFELTRMEPSLYAQIQNLKDNEVSLVLKDEDNRGKVSYKLLTVTDRIDEHKADYARDFLKIKELALKEKQLKSIEEWQAKKIIDTYVKIEGDYKSCNFSGNWLKK